MNNTTGETKVGRCTQGQKERCQQYQSRKKGLTKDPEREIL